MVLQTHIYYKLGILAAGNDGMDKKKDPGKPLLINMYTDYKDYPHLKKLPSDLESALEKLDESKELNEAFGEKVINSYIKLKNNEINNFNAKEIFSKEKPITDWEKLNTLDC